MSLFFCVKKLKNNRVVVCVQMSTRLFKRHNDVRILPLSEHLTVYYIWIRLLVIILLVESYGTMNISLDTPESM